MLRYATRNHALVPAVGWALADGHLTQEADSGRSRVIQLRDARELRLEFAPTRPEPNRYRCRLVLASGEAVEFFNRTYRGVYDFADTSADYITFVHGLLAALREHAPACRFVSGTSAGNYLLGVAGFVMAVGAVLLVLLFALTVGLWWLVLVKAALIVFYLPVAWSWLRRNRERIFDPACPPAAVLPQILAQS